MCRRWVYFMSLSCVVCALYVVWAQYKDIKHVQTLLAWSLLAVCVVYGMGALRYKLYGMCAVCSTHGVDPLQCKTMYKGGCSMCH